MTELLWVNFRTAAMGTIIVAGIQTFMDLRRDRDFVSVTPDIRYMQVGGYVGILLFTFSLFMVLPFRYDVSEMIPMAIKLNFIVAMVSMVVASLLGMIIMFYSIDDGPLSKFFDPRYLNRGLSVALLIQMIFIGRGV